MTAESIILMIICLSGVWGGLIWAMLRLLHMQNEQGDQD